MVQNDQFFLLYVTELLNIKIVLKICEHHHVSLLTVAFGIGFTQVGPMCRLGDVIYMFILK